MGRITTSAQLALAAKRLAQTKGSSDSPLVDMADTEAKRLAVQGGFRAGKRRRGNSLLKREAKQTTRVTTYYLTDTDGNTVGRYSTLYGKREQ